MPNSMKWALFLVPHRTQIINLLDYYYWKEEFDKRRSPSGKDYYWLTGEFELLDKGEDTDIWALENGYVSVVPTQFDLTAHHQISKLNSWVF